MVEWRQRLRENWPGILGSLVGMVEGLVPLVVCFKVWPDWPFIFVVAESASISLVLFALTMVGIELAKRQGQHGR